MANNKSNRQSKINLLPILAAVVVVVCVAVVLIVNRNGGANEGSDTIAAGNANETVLRDDIAGTRNNDNSGTKEGGYSGEAAQDTADIPVNQESENSAADAKNTQSGKAAVIIEKGDSLVIPVSEITEEATFYPVEVDGTSMEVFAIRASDGTIRTAFNTCQSCYTSGAGFYTMQAEDLVCNNCGFHFSPDQVEVSAGGCNPWPIYPEDKTVTDDSITISYEFLSESKDIFANWKTAMN